MFSALRTRFGIPGVISTIALVLAMTGGAFAAKYLITSTKQISPSVLKKLKGATGPAGANGVAGAQGPKGDAGANGQAGAQGAAGSKGAEGPKGTDGKSVEVTPIAVGFDECNKLGGAEVKEEGGGSSVEVCNGKDGEKGKEGSPWTAGGTLPVGATQTGIWALNGTAANTAGIAVPISFPIKLNVVTILGEDRVHYVKPFEAVPDCTVDGFAGTPSNPVATSGHLCVYESIEGGVVNATFDSIREVEREGIGASKVGALLLFKELTGVAKGGGTWAVTG